jgi:hypothetical protein
MTLEELARTTPQQPEPAPIQQRPELQGLIKPAPKELKHKIAEGCRLQILQDIKDKQNPYRMLLTAAEAISRLDDAGDTFYLQVREKLIEVYGHDISEESTELI